MSIQKVRLDLLIVRAILRPYEYARWTISKHTIGQSSSSKFKVITLPCDHERSGCDSFRTKLTVGSRTISSTHRF